MNLRRLPLLVGLSAAAVALLLVGLGLRPPAPSASPSASASRTVRPEPAAAVVPLLPAPTGPHAIGRADLRLVDRQRTDPFTHRGPRELMVSVWYPASDTAGRPRAPWMPPAVARGFAANASRILGLPTGLVDWSAVTTHAAVDAPPAAPVRHRPVVLYSPGLGTSRSWGTVLVEELASRGYVVVTLDHTYEALAVDLGDGRIAEAVTAGSGTDEGLARRMRVRAADTGFVLDALARPSTRRALPAELGAQLDLDRIGMFGHSAGGITAAETMARDLRLDAGLDLDGFNVTPARRSWPELDRLVRDGLDRPFQMVGSTATPAEELPARLRAGSPASVSVRRLADTAHYSFSDFQALLPQLRDRADLSGTRTAQLIGTAAPQAMVHRERAIVTGFFDRNLLRPGRTGG
ncbi:lipase [Streptomyces sp. V4I2]|uniref:alpha/beta hydrolase family protein n=1 Tax=Streptomyces sp. V4I2 TaxID=3042280 RepID=UPI00278027D3|nr:lipase [Streptomyces sp. V4I2]MDQ1045000.1 dienelactone hydrolase [Streptomyces sp. V4I2]